MKVLIIGLGSIAKKHIDVLMELYNDIVIYSLRSSEKSEKYLKVINIFSLKDVVNINFDFCIISSPTAHHLEDIKKVLHLDLPLFIEKPLFSSLDDKGLLKVINEKKINTYVACNLRFLDSLLYVKNNYLNDDYLKINEVNVYCGSYLPEWRPNTDYKKSYSANAVLGGGVHIDLIHEIDYVFWFFGKPKNTIRSCKSKSTLAINAIDYANFTLFYDNFTTSVILNYYRRDAKRCMEIVFDDYTVKVDLLKNCVYQNNKLIYKSEQKLIETYKPQLQYFLNNIRNNNSFNRVEEAFEVLKISLH
jgi:predicted dehydrogenase